MYLTISKTIRCKEFKFYSKGKYTKKILLLFAVELAKTFIRKDILWTR